MYKSKSIKKTIVVAAAAGMLITTSLGTVSASQLLNDSTVGISSAFDKYASSLAGGADKDTDSSQKNVATASDAAKPVSGSSTKDDIVAADKKTDGDKSETKKIKKIKYPQFEDRCIAVTDDYVNIRSAAGIDSDVVGIIGNAGVADVVEKGKEWTKVSSGNCVGYIRNDLLLYGDDAGEYAEANCSKMATVNTETLNVREQADTSADCITQVGAGQSFDILSQTDKWVQIALDDQTSGYVSADYIEYTYKLDEAKTLEELQAEIQAQEDAQKQAEEDEADAGETQDATDAQDTSDDQGTDDAHDTYDNQDTDDDSYDGNSGTDGQYDYDQDSDDSQDASDGQGSSDGDDGSDTTAAPSGQTGIDLANYATQFVGNPYVYGGSSLTDGADCSGFVMAVYAQFGYSLPHSAGAQSGYGTRVDTASLEPGDILFYGYDGSIEHCAIYIGDGMIVHASTEETGIKISSAFYSTPICAVRLLGQ